MKLQEALHAVQYMDKHPIARRCMLCKDFLDEQSRVLVTEMIKQNRTDIDVLFSDGVCPECIEHYNELVK
jgi:hypothetical protein